MFWSVQMNNDHVSLVRTSHHFMHAIRDIVLKDHVRIKQDIQSVTTADLWHCTQTQNNQASKMRQYRIVLCYCITHNTG